jgi:chromosome segregation ATPase
MNSIETLQQDLEKLKQEAQTARAEISRLENDLAAAKSNLLIAEKKAELNQAIQKDTDSKLPEPVWSTEETIWSAPRNQIISRVTPKQIYLRAIGDAQETSYKRETGSSSWGKRLDVPATIAAWEAYKTSC